MTLRNISILTNNSTKCSKLSTVNKSNVFKKLYSPYFFN